MSDQGSDLAVNPATGEVLEHLEQQPPATLAEALAAVRDQQAQLTEWSRALEGELRRRLKVQERTVAQFGGYQVTSKPTNRSVWDVELFEAELTRLVESGVLRAAEVTEVIKREISVRAGEANKLIARLDGEPKQALIAARSWREEQGRVTVERHTPELEETTEQAPPADIPARSHSTPSGGPVGPAESQSTQPPAPAPALDPEELFA
jgi:hypothetical protein